MQIARTLEHYWMPFTDNARFKAAPKLIMERTIETCSRRVLNEPDRFLERNGCAT